MKLSQLHHAPSFNPYPQSQLHTQTILAPSLNHLIQQQQLHSTQKKFHSKSMIHKKNTSSIAVSPIQQCQQPLQYLNQLTVRKHPSLISCKSQPLSLTSCNKIPINSIFSKRQSRQKQIIATKTQGNDNIKTRKKITKPNNVNNEGTLTNLDHEYYNLGNTQNQKKVRSNQIRKMDLNQKTLRVNNKCRHKNQTQLQNGISLQNIKNRLQQCQTYIELSQRKTNLLTRELDYLMTKQLQRQQRRTKKIQNHRLKHQNQKHLITLLFSLSPKKFTKSKDKSTSKNQNQKQLHQNQLQLHSRNKFHFRSHSTKLQKIKSLIYFHQKQTNHKILQCGHEKQTKIKAKNNKQFKFNDKHNINQMPMSIYDY